MYEGEGKLFPFPLRFSLRGVQVKLTEADSQEKRHNNLFFNFTCLGAPWKRRKNPKKQTWGLIYNLFFKNSFFFNYFYLFFGLAAWHVGS